MLRASGLTRDAFAESLGIQGPFVSLLTSGKRELSLDVARRIHARYGYRVGWQLEGELPKKADQTAEGPPSLLEQVQQAIATLRVVEHGLRAEASTPAPAPGAAKTAAIVRRVKAAGEPKPRPKGKDRSA